MKLLVFAHTPPPFHGQSYMVQLLLEGLGENHPATERSSPSLEIHHINARVSEDLKDIGGMRAGKIFQLLRHCSNALWQRFRYGVKTFYYIPAPPKNSALFRDWMVMLICRPFFPRLILHWHAQGLGAWIDRQPRWKKTITHFFLDRVHCSIVLTGEGAADAAHFKPRQTRIIPNGIPDPCPAFAESLLPARLARLKARQGLPQNRSSDAGSIPPIFKVLFLAHCTREKGLFDALDCIACSNRELAARQNPLRIHLTVAGSFMDAAEEREFFERIGRPDLMLEVTFAGFVSDDPKKALLEESDLLLFPTRYQGEALPVLLLEAMAFGLPIVTTTWRGIDRLLPENYPGACAPGDQEGLLRLLLEAPDQNAFAQLRRHFLEHYEIAQHLRQMEAAFREN